MIRPLLLAFALGFPFAAGYALAADGLARGSWKRAMAGIALAAPLIASARSRGNRDARLPQGPAS